MSTVRETVQNNIIALVDYEGSASAFADRLGVSRQSVNNRVNGKNAPDIEMINQIARVYRVPLSVILEGDMIRQGIRQSDVPTETSGLGTLSTDEQNLLAFYRQMNDEDKKTFMRNAQLFAFAGEAKKRDDLRISKGARRTIKQ